LFANKRILVTGGAGFLGSHLCERLLAEGNEVLCVDNFFTSNKQNIAHLLIHPRFELIRHDVTFPLYVESDEIYNLACPASPIHYQRDPVQTMLELAEKVIKLTGSKSQIRLMPLPSDDPKQRQPDIKLAKGKLGWEPITQLDEGLTKTIDYYKEVISN